MGGNIVDAIDGGHEMSGHIFIFIFCRPKLRLIHFIVGLSSIKRGPKGDCIDISQMGFTKVKAHGI